MTVPTRDSLPARELFLRWQREPDEDARSALLERHTPLARVRILVGADQDPGPT